MKMKCEEEKKNGRSAFFSLLRSYVSLHERIEYNKLSTLIDFLVSDETEQISYEKKIRNLLLKLPLFKQTISK